MRKSNIIIYLYVISAMLVSCASIRKDTSSSKTEQTTNESSSRQKDYVRETTTTEQGTEPVVTAPDSLQAYGAINGDDTTTYHQDVETDDMSLSTTVKPKVSNGKITGYDINSKAVSKSKTVQAPVNKTTTTRETGNIQQQETKQQVTNSETKESSKQAFRLNGWGMLAIAGVAALIIIFIYFRKK